jgi:ribonuclease P protein component
MRETARPLLGNITESCDIVVVARKALIAAPFVDVAAHLERLLKRAGALSISEE